MVSHLPLTAAIAAMGAAMISLVARAHDGRTPSPRHGYCARALPSCCARRCWHRQACKPGNATQPGTSRLTRTCGAVADACLGVGAARRG
jgi:hypothetical protein